MTTIQIDFDGGVYQSSADTGFGTTTVLHTIGASERAMLLLPDLSSLAGETIASAILTLTLGANYGGGGNANISVVRIKAANNGWNEWCSWNFADTDQRWAGDTGSDGGADAGCSVSGTDYEATAIGTGVVSVGATTGTAINITLDTAQFQSQVADNNGWRLKNSRADTVGFCSSNHATAGYRPYLTVTTAEPVAGKPTYAYAQQ